MLPALLCLLASSTPVEQARLHLEEADFEAARAVLSAPARTRAELVSLTELRALLHLALGEDAPLQTELQKLVALDYNRAFDASVNPDLVTRYLAVRAQAAGALQVELQLSLDGDTASAEARVRNDVGLVRRLFFEYRLDEGEWTAAPKPQLQLGLQPGQTLQVRARAESETVALAEAKQRLQRPAEAGISPWLWVTGAAAVVAAAATVAVIATRPSGSDELPTPVVRWP